MAWFALYKWFIVFRTKPYINWIHVYQRMRYDEWLSTLPEYERQYLKEAKEKS